MELLPVNKSLVIKPFAFTPNVGPYATLKSSGLTTVKVVGKQ